MDLKFKKLWVGNFNNKSVIFLNYRYILNYRVLKTKEAKTRRVELLEERSIIRTVSINESGVQTDKSHVSANELTTQA